MASKATRDSGRTGTKRFEETFDADELIEGDRIAPKLVAHTFDQLAKQIKRIRQGRDSEPRAQLVAITEINRGKDIQSALLAEIETGIIVRASRINSNSEWTQQEADWKVLGIGTEVIVEEVKELEAPGYELYDPEKHKHVQHWVDIVIGGPANGYEDPEDSRYLAGSAGATLELSDVNGRKVIASISLEE